MIDNNLLNKKLLILGANPETIPLIETAKKMGVRAIVTDNNPNALAKKYADQAFNVDGMDVEGLISLAKEQKVNGVLVGVADRLIEPYQQVCEALNLPCYSNKEQSKILTNKYLFKQYSEQLGIKNIPSIVLKLGFSMHEIDELNYPIFVKPVDGNSGKGMSLCSDLNELKLGIKKAFENSKSGTILLERYMDCDDILINYTIVDGIVCLSALADRHTTKEQGNVSRVCLGATYPSQHLTAFKTKYHDKFVNLFNSLSLKNGIFTISAFVENDEFYAYDPGFRLQGEAPNLHMEAVNGFDQKEMLINLALCGNMGAVNENKLSNTNFDGKHSATVWFLAKKGRIIEITGLDELNKDGSVFKIVQRLHVGDVITEDMIGTEAQVLARVYLVAESLSDLSIKVDIIQNTIKVFDKQQNLMLLKGFKLWK